MKRHRVHRVLGVLVSGVLALTGCGQGCSCSPPTTADAGPGSGRLIIARPLNGATITLADDEDALSEGINLTVEVRGDGVPDGAQVTLSSSVGGGRAPVALAGGKAVFAGVTLVAGEPPEGLLNELTASASGHVPDTIALTVVGDAVNLCRFLVPLDQATLSQDANTTLSGFQSPVQVACSGDAIPGDAEVSLLVNGAGQRQAALASGLASFADVTLVEGSNTLLAYTHSRAGARVADVQIGVTVDTGACDATIAAPAPGVLDASLNDLDPATPALLDLAFTVTSARCPAGTAQLSVNGSLAGNGTLVAGSGTVQVALPQGAVEVVATVQQSGRPDGQSATALYTVDTLAPEIAIERPLDHARIGLSDDEEAPPSPANGITTTLAGHVVHPEGVSLSLAVARAGAPLAGSPFAVAVDADSGAFALALANLAAGDYVATLTALDAAGNSDAATVHFVVDLSDPVVALAVASDLDHDGWLEQVEDVSPSEEHYQFDLRVVVAGVTDATLYAADATVQPVDAGGAPTEAATTASQPFAADGTATLRFTLPQGGRVQLTAVARDGAGRTSPPSDAQFVVVDFEPPLVLIQSPADQSVRASRALNLLGALWAPDLDPTSLQLTINGSPSSVVPTVEAGSVLYAGLELSGASDETYRVVLSAADLAGNLGQAAVQVRVDLLGPELELVGWASPAASRRLLALATDAASPTVLATAAEPALDYAPALEGLQFGFRVMVHGETEASLGGGALARLDIQGQGQPLFAPLQPIGQDFEAVFDGGGEGLSLADGPLRFVATVDDALGNSRSDTRFALVRTSQYYVRIDSPADGSVLPGAAVQVVASGSVFDGAACELQVDGEAVQHLDMQDGLLQFPVQLLGSEGPHGLRVRCDIGAGEVASSQELVVQVDVTPPAGAAFALASLDGPGALPLDGFLNLQWASADVLRLVRDVIVSAAAEDGSCPLQDPLLAVAPVEPSGPLAHYPARGLAGARWTLDGEACLATFADVDLGALAEPGQRWTLSAEVQDLAGNAAIATHALVVDRVAPTLVQTFPAAGVGELGVAFDEDPATPGLQLQGTRAWTFEVADRALEGDLTLQYSGVEAGDAAAPAVPGQVRVETSWAQDGTHQVTVEVWDEAGNVTRLGPSDYLVDLSAPAIRLLDRNDDFLADALAAASPQAWTEAFDVDPAGGGQFDLWTRVEGVRAGFELRLCSDRPPAGGSTACQSAAGPAPVAGFVVGRVNLVSGGSGVVRAALSAVELAQGAQQLYAEADDEVGNHASTFPVQVRVDTYAPLVEAVVVVNNVGGNDGACDPALCLGLGESPSDVVVRVGSGGDGEDLAGRVVTLRSSNPDQGPVPGATLLGVAPSFVATFPGVALAQGAHVLSVELTDALGNPARDPGAVNPPLFVDTVPPVLIAHAPGEEAQFTSAVLDLILRASDGQNPLDAAPVALHNDTTGEFFAGHVSPGSDEARFPDLALRDDAVNALHAVVHDRVGNASASYGFAYDVDTRAPAVTLREPASGTTLIGLGACLRSDAFHVALTGVNRSTRTRLQLQARVAGSADAWGVVIDSDRAATADVADLQLAAPEPCLQPGLREVRARVYETDTGHETTTAAILVDVDTSVPVVTLRALDGAVVQSGHRFAAPLDQNPAAGTYTTTLTVEALTADLGSTVRLLVNGVPTGGDQPLGAGHQVSFAGVLLRDFGATGLDNTLRAEVTDGNTGVSEATGCRADGDAPGIAFASSAPRTYLYVDDTVHTSAGLQAAAGNGVAFATTGLDFEVGSASLHCTGVATDAILAVVDNAGEFVNLPGLRTALAPYLCTLRVVDSVGNQGSSAESKSLTVDIDRPSTPRVVPCLGENACHGAGCVPTRTYEKDDNVSTDATPYVCYDSATAGGACGDGVGVNPARCSRRGGRVSLTWSAPGDNAGSGGAVAGYLIRYREMPIVTSPSCADMSGAIGIDTAGMPIVLPGLQQTFVVEGLAVHRDYCFEVTARDARGNLSAATPVLRRAPLVVGYRTTGTGASFGEALSLGGDLDGDGLADVVVGEPGYANEVNGALNYGRVVVHYASAARPDTVIRYPADHPAYRFGHAVSSGDFDGDGVSDLVVSEPAVDEPANTVSRLYLYFGTRDQGLAQAPNPDQGDLPSLWPDVVIDNYETWIGTALSNRALNLDGDTRSDASGEHRLDDIAAFGWTPGAYVPAVFTYRGRARADWVSLPATLGVPTLDAASGADMVFAASAGNLAEQAAVLSGGDFDGDGRDELVVPWFNNAARGVGAVYVVYGRDPLVDLETAELGTTSGVYALLAPSGQRLFGASAVVLDGTGDGAMDLAVYEERTGTRQVYFYRGTPGAQAEPLQSGAPLAVTSSDPLAIESMGDVDGDGIADLCLGISDALPAAGDLYSFSGGAAGLAAAARLLYAANPSFGRYLASGGDVDGNGFPDLVVIDRQGSNTLTLLR